MVHLDELDELEAAAEDLDEQLQDLDELEAAAEVERVIMGRWGKMGDRDITQLHVRAAKNRQAVLMEGIAYNEVLKAQGFVDLATGFVLDLGHIEGASGDYSLVAWPWLKSWGGVRALFSNEPVILRLPYKMTMPLVVAGEQLEYWDEAEWLVSPPP